MKIFTSQELENLVQITCKSQNISTIDMMERAASAVSVEIISSFLPSRRIVVMAGAGRKGGIALAASRMLYEQGYKNLEILLFNITGDIVHDTDEERKRLITIDGLDFTEVTGTFYPPYLSSADIVLDGMCDADISGKMTGGFVHLARYINESGAYVISIDTPSGLMGEDNRNINTRDMIHATETLVFQNPRLSFFFPENQEVVGKWKLIDLDYDREYISTAKPVYRYIDAQNIRPLIKPRNPYSGKRDYGSALLFAGSTGMTGAAVLAAQAILRSGAGLATVHGPKGSMEIVQTAVPEVMYEPDRNEHFIADMTVHYRHQAVAAGPGIGTRPQTIDALESLLKNVPDSLILDADALNCISKRPALLSMLPHAMIITPHIGEFDRLFGEHYTHEERLRTGIKIAVEYKIVIVLKGHSTMVIRPTGTVCINSTGNAGMATAGAGDVLTGVITALVAQGYSPGHAATIGVFVHGLAGDIAAEELGEFGVTASEISKRVGRAIRQIVNKS